MEDGGGAAIPSTYFRPRESERTQYTEKKISDKWRAWWETQSLPADATVANVLLIPYRGERPVVAWKDGAGCLPEGEVHEGEDVLDAIKRIANEQCGILHATSRHLGHYKYTASSFNKDVPAGTTNYHALYVLDVTELGDGPTDEGFGRRTVQQRDLNEIIRRNHIESRREYADALDEWLLERLKAQAAAGARAPEDPD
jgi:predicted NUDIX family NTP pyrophosphohydrolase